MFVDAARARGEAMDHVLLFGPPGLGQDDARANPRARTGRWLSRHVSGPVIARAGDLAALLTNLEPRDVLFIDEIHRLAPAVEEILYPAMEDYHLDLIIGEGPSRAQRAHRPLRRSRSSAPPRARGCSARRCATASAFRCGSISTRPKISSASCSAPAAKLGAPMTAEGAVEIAKRARGTPRVAVRLLRRVRDFADAGDERDRRETRRPRAEAPRSR